MELNVRLPTTFPRPFFGQAEKKSKMVNARKRSYVWEHFSKGSGGGGNCGKSPLFFAAPPVLCGSPLRPVVVTFGFVRGAVRYPVYREKGRRRLREDIRAGHGDRLSYEPPAIGARIVWPVFGRRSGSLGKRSSPEASSPDDFG